MNYLLNLLPILFHRIGLILALISAVILVLLPRIFTEIEDAVFSHRVYRVLLYALRVGLVLLFLTGSIRLLDGIPRGFFIKLVSATFTLIWGFVYTPEYDDKEYLRYFSILTFLLCITAIIGIFL